ncbi:VirB4 family type IV secretion system protein [Verrucomicrobium sp. 3C]|uniref:VirB4 family type IV secretion system protein n=1 Tax=Verrucomicrobium sp. 3C TaxID=1134055 RepID=UPI000379A53C|nr:ATP-binding protein [Verrucomicrobium sp. 3C]
MTAITLLRKLRPKPISFRPNRDQTPVDFANVLPYAGDPVDGTLIDKFGGVHAFFDVRFPHPEAMSMEGVERLFDQISQVYCRLPQGIVQVAYHWVANGDFEEELRSAEGYPNAVPSLRRDALARIRTRIAGRKLTSVSLICVLCARPERPEDQRPAWQRKLSASASDYVIPRKISQTEWRRAVDAIDTAEPVLREMIRSVHGEIRRMNMEELASHLYRLLNPDLAIDYRVPFPGGSFLSSFLCSPVQLLPDSIRWGEYYHGMVALAQLPRRTRPTDADFLASQIPFRDYRITAIVRRRNNAQAAAELLDEISKQEALAPVFGRGWLDTILGAGFDQDIVEKMERTKRIEGNPEYRARIDEAKALHKDILSGREEAVVVQWTVHLWHRDLAELRKRRSIVLAILGNVCQAKGWSYGPDGLIQIFVSSLPGVYAPLVYTHRCPSRVAGDLTPSARGLRSGERAVSVFEAGGGLIALDPYSRENVAAPIHGVSGQTGAGKSVLLGKLALDAHQRDGTMVILERGWSYEALVGLLGGQTIRFDHNHPVRLNPLEAFSPDGRVIEPDSATIATVEQAVIALLAAAGSAPQGSEEQLRLNSCLKQTFADAATREKHAELSDLHRKLRAVSGGERLASGLRLFTREGSHGAWFDGPTELSIRSKVVYFDVDGLVRAQDLQDPTRDMTLSKAYVSLLAMLARKLLLARNQSSKILLFGEFWSFLNDPTLSALILEAMKTYRKEGVAVFAETQSLRDLRRNESVGVAVEQSVHTWFLLEQGPMPEIEEAAKFLALWDGEREILQSLRSGSGTDPDGEPNLYREALLVRGTGTDRLSGRIRIRLEPEERWLLTTNTNERKLRQEVIAEFGGDVERAIRALAVKYPCGQSS